MPKSNDDFRMFLSYHSHMHLLKLYVDTQRIDTRSSDRRRVYTRSVGLGRDRWSFTRMGNLITFRLFYFHSIYIYIYRMVQMKKAITMTTKTMTTKKKNRSASKMKSHRKRRNCNTKTVTTTRRKRCRTKWNIDTDDAHDDWNNEVLKKINEKNWVESTKTDRYGKTASWWSATIIFGSWKEIGKKTREICLVEF